MRQAMFHHLVKIRLGLVASSAQRPSAVDMYQIELGIREQTQQVRNCFQSEKA